MSTKILKLKWEGIRPLILSNPQTVQISNEYSVMSRSLGRKMKDARKAAKEETMVELEHKTIRNDWEASAYWDDEATSFYLPDTVIHAVLRSGAMKKKRGKDIESDVIVCEPRVNIQTIKHKSLDEYFKSGKFSLECPARIPPKTGALIWKCRCMIPIGWKLEFTVEVGEEVPDKVVEDASEDAGKMKGVGGWRPKFGRFLSEMEAV